MGVLEAIAHGESAHRAYVIYATSRAEFDVAPEGERIMELAGKSAKWVCDIVPESNLSGQC